MFIFNIGNCEEIKNDKQNIKKELKTNDVNKKDNIKTKNEKVEKLSELDKVIKEIDELLNDNQDIVYQIEELKNLDSSDYRLANAYGRRCASCHGLNGEVPAMGRAKIINKFTKEELIKAIKGYKAGTYGGGLKNFMRPHVMDLTKEKIEEIAQQIVDIRNK